jgi:hypothetical protein
MNWGSVSAIHPLCRRTLSSTAGNSAAAEGLLFEVSAPDASSRGESFEAVESVYSVHSSLAKKLIDVPSITPNS